MEDQNAIDAAMTALISEDAMTEKMGRTIWQALGMTHWLLSHCQKIRKSIEDKDLKGWV